MKRYQSQVPSILFVVLLMGSVAHVHAVMQGPPNPEIESLERAAERARNLALMTQVLQGQGLRGGATGGSQMENVPGVARFLQAPVYRNTRLSGAWWTNTALVERLGLTEDQKARIERAFENHRQNIVSTTESFEKEEAQLARLLEAEPLDRNAVLTQTDRVIQARSEMERANASMTLEMREHLTRAQWLQLPRMSWVGAPVAIAPGGRGGRGPAPLPTSPPSPGPGQRRGRGQ